MSYADEVSRLETANTRLLAENAVLKQQRDALLLGASLAERMLKAATLGNVAPTSIRSVANDLKGIIDTAVASHG
jgi:hypothetical protein